MLERYRQLSKEDLEEVYNDIVKEFMDCPYKTPAVIEYFRRRLGELGLNATSIDEEVRERLRS